MQDLQLLKAESTITDYLDGLQNNEISLQALLQNDQELVVYMTQTLDHIYEKAVNFDPNLDLSETSILL